MYKPVLSTLTRSHVPAPSNRVHTHPAAAGNEPIIVLFTPVVIETPAFAPIAMLLPVDEAEYNAHRPTPTLFDPTILFLRAP
jgi:hypothetical protein